MVYCFDNALSYDFAILCKNKIPHWGYKNISHGRTQNYQHIGCWKTHMDTDERNPLKFRAGSKTLGHGNKSCKQQLAELHGATSSFGGFYGGYLGSGEWSSGVQGAEGSRQSDSAKCIRVLYWLGFVCLAASAKSMKNLLILPGNKQMHLKWFGFVGSGDWGYFGVPAKWLTSTRTRHLGLLTGVDWNYESAVRPLMKTGTSCKQ